ncbi:MAG: DUF4097 domain-containing protein [Dehalococcoidia bacterium]
MTSTEISQHNPLTGATSRATLWLIGAALAAILLTACSFGSTETVVQEDSFTVGASPRLNVVSENGKVTVLSAGSSPTVQVTATIKNPDRVNYAARQEGSTVTVAAEVEKGFNFFGDSAGVRIEVLVPENIALDLETSNGSVSVTGVSGPVSVATSNGGIDITNVVGEVNARTSNGKIDIGEVSGQVDAETSNGAVRMTAALQEGSKNRLRTSNGSVNVTLVDTPRVNLNASTSNGTISTDRSITTTGSSDPRRLVGTIGEGGPDLEIRTSNGSVTIR